MHLKHLAIGALFGLTAIAQADVVLDQISTTEADHLTFWISTNFSDAANDAFDTTTLDDFTVTAAQLHVFSVEAVMGMGNLSGAMADTTWANVTNFRIEVFSSAAASGGSASGDVASFSVAPVSASFVNLGWGSVNSSARHWTFPVSIDLPAAGTYYLGVEGEIVGGSDFKQTFVSSNATNPGNQNLVLANSAGGFGLGGGANWETRAEDAMYKVEAAAPVPEPATLLVLGAGAALVGYRRRKKTA